MGRPRRNVRFHHRAATTDARQSSDLSDISEPPSPNKNGASRGNEGISEEVRLFEYMLLEPFWNWNANHVMVFSLPAVEIQRAYRLRIREEKTDFHNPDDMDICYDRRFLHCHVLRPHLSHCHHHGCPDHFVQGGHRHCKRPQQGQEPQVHQVAQLVLPCNDNVFSVWRERDILFQAHPTRR